MMTTSQECHSSLFSSIDLSTVGVVIPTYNAARHWAEFAARLSRQGIPPSHILVIDSSSLDGTSALARSFGYNVIQISTDAFRHGGTRQLGCEYFSAAEVLVYLTQDALLEDENAIRLLTNAFTDHAVGAAYGRQLPRPGAKPIESYARAFNYPSSSHIRTLESRHTLGLKAAFLSNSFAAYRRAALLSVGGFPNDVIMAEDSVVAARMLMQGWSVAYVAEAAVVHSHDLDLWHEFRRYFDTGVHHADQPWIRSEFGQAGTEGRRYVTSELRFLLSTAPHLIPSSLLRTLSKAFAFNLGLREGKLPVRLSKRLSLQPSFWDRRPQR